MNILISQFSVSYIHFYTGTFISFPIHYLINRTRHYIRIVFPVCVSDGPLQQLFSVYAHAHATCTGDRFSDETQGHLAVIIGYTRYTGK